MYSPVKSGDLEKSQEIFELLSALNCIPFVLITHYLVLHIV